MSWTTKALIAMTLIVAGAALAMTDGTAQTPALADPETIVITELPEDLDRCVATLESVFFAPVHAATVVSATLSSDAAGPTVTCVAQ
ncbi:hypothetical protein [Celeribacter baekdonensis]|uniref:Uncharacterized protein n=1 Tax=Celeribacter baekdonensis B30 TaxID=1208323 RepID=K2JH45_9RHOB|nr:hypothetical protein [Celeribacter baekdonensis]EKE69994.1 hypothetical protein B30_13944 [Celeribacter baekdonensis B30]